MAGACRGERRLSDRMLTAGVLFFILKAAGRLISGVLIGVGLCFEKKHHPLSLFFLLHQAAGGILVLQPGIEPSALRAWGPKPWSTREFCSDIALEAGWRTGRWRRRWGWTPLLRGYCSRSGRPDWWRWW